jgi:hypothetical protein
MNFFMIISQTDGQEDVKIDDRKKGKWQGTKNETC